MFIFSNIILKANIWRDSNDTEASIYLTSPNIKIQKKNLKSLLENVHSQKFIFI